MALKWSPELMKMFKRVSVTVYPWATGTAGTKEFFAMISGRKARNANPECELKMNIADDAQTATQVEFVYSDDTTKTLKSQHLGTGDILDHIFEHTRDLQVHQFRKSLDEEFPSTFFK